MVTTVRPMDCTDKKELLLIEQLFVVEEKILLTTSVQQQATVRKMGFGSRKFIYIKLAIRCKDKLTQLEKDRQSILAQLE